MTDTPAPPAPDNDHGERIARLERESQEHRDHRVQVRTLLGLASAAALVVILGAVSVRDVTLSTSGRVEALTARLDLYAASAPAALTVDVLAIVTADQSGGSL